MMITTKDLFQYLLVVLILLWPIWVLGLVFLRGVYLKVGSFLGSPKRERPAASQEKGQPKPVEKMIGISS